MGSTLFIEPCINTKLFKKDLDTMGKMAKSMFNDIDKMSGDMEFSLPEFPDNIGEQFLMPLEVLAAGVALAFEPLTLTLQSINEQLIILNDSAIQSGSGIGELFSALGSGLATATNIVVIGASWTLFSDTITSAITGVSAWAETSGIAAAATGVFSGATEVLGGVIGALASPVGLVVLAIAGLVAIGYLFSDSFDEIFSGVSERFGGFVTSIGDWCSSMYADFIQPIITNLFDWFKKIWDDNLKNVVDGVCGFVAKIGELLIALGNFFLPIVKFLGEVFGPIFTNVINAIIDTIGLLVNTVLGFASGLLDIFNGILDFFIGVFTGNLEDCAKGIAEIFSGIFKLLAELLKGIANLMIWSINMLIVAIYTAIAAIFNGLGSLIKSLGEILGFSDWGFKMPVQPPQIPYLARGGIIDQPTLALIGERGREAVMPLENNTEWITDLANQIGSVIAAQSVMSGANRQGSGGGSVNLYLDGRKFAEAAIDDFSSVANRRGISVLARA